MTCWHCNKQLPTRVETLWEAVSHPECDELAGDIYVAWEIQEDHPPLHQLITELGFELEPEFQRRYEEIIMAKTKKIFNFHAMLSEFGKAFDRPAPPKPVAADAALGGLRIQLILEEIGEIAKSAGRGDLEGYADALGDTMYVVVGTAVELGYKIGDEVFIEPEGTPRCPSPNELGSILQALSTGIYQISTFLQNQDTTGTGQALIGTIELLVNISKVCGIPLGAVVEEIHRANMDKLDKNGKPVVNELGRVLKPEGWQAPNILGVLESHS